MTLRVTERDYLLRQSWSCPLCLIEALPFRDLGDLEDTGIFNVAQQESADVGRGFPTFKLHHYHDHERPMLNREDLDPDLNITFTSNCSSKYIDITEAGKKTVEYRNNLSIMHINCRSIIPKMTEISLLIEQVPISILAVTETWLSDDLNGLVNIPGYCFLHQPRPGACGEVSDYS